MIIIISVLLFLVMILVHEFGHFIMAKLFKVKVNEFSVGFGPKLFKKQGKETLYTFRAIPIGGFCAMEGEDEESADERAFGNSKVWKRILIVVAGGIFNIILGLIFMLVIQAQSPAYATTTIAAFSENAASQSCGLQVNDRILSVNGYKVINATDASFAMALDEDGVMDFIVERDGEEKTIGITFDTVENDGITQTVLDFKVYGEEKTFGTLMEHTFTETVSYIRLVYVSLWRLITGQSGVKDMAGPVGIASIIGQAAQAGFKESFVAGLNNVLEILALITVNLGIFNLLPLPALDGGRLVFLVIEGIRRKPINPKYEGVVH